MPPLPHLSLSPPVDKAAAKHRETGEGAEQYHMRQVAVWQDMRRRPYPERQKQGMPRQADDSGLAGSNRSFCAPPKEKGFGRAIASDRITQTGSITASTTWFCHGAQSQSGT